MPFLVFPRHLIVADPAHPADLASLPEPELLACIRDLYSFLPTLTHVELRGRFVHFTLTQATGDPARRAFATRRRARAAARDGRHPTAIRLYRAVLDVLPEHITARCELAQAYLAVGDLPEAAAELIRALRLHPFDLPTRLALVQVYIAMHDPAAAAHCYRTAAIFAPDHPDILNALATPPNLIST